MTEHLNQKSEPIRVVVFTQEEPFFIPKVIRTLLNDPNSDTEIIAAAVLKPHRKNKNMLHWFSERLKIYTFKELFIAGFAFAYCRVIYPIFMRLGASPLYAVRRTFEQENIPILQPEDINAVSFIQSMKLLKPHVFLSISCPQIFEEKLLGVPQYAINAHGTLLPRHRGVFGSWWTIFHEDNEAGSTLHYMLPRLDAGAIVWQESFSVEKKETQYSLAFKTKKLIAIGCLKTLEMIKSNAVAVLKPVFEESYHRAPTKEQAKSFQLKGKKIIKWSDLSLIFAREF